MAFRASSSPFGGLLGNPSNAQSHTGPDLEEIQTEALAFQAVAGEIKVRLLPCSWPPDSLPPPTASLLSIASKKGLLAAGGPEAVIIAATDSVREAFSKTVAADANIKPFSPQLTLNVGMRVSQVAFSADEAFLVLSAENGGGLAVYDVQSIMQGSTQSAFEISTNGTSLRALVPNPTPERAELFAAVTMNGELLIANLKTRQLTTGPQGQVLKSGVSSISWSFRGKQLVAGLGDGTCHQMTPEGEGKEDIYRPPGLDVDHHVSSIYWLENEVFLVAHTPSSSDGGMAPITAYHLITREAKNRKSMVFQKLPEPCPPFGLNRSPPFQFMHRLKDFPPNLLDLIVVASTASADIGLITRSKTPLSSGLPAENISNVFTTTTMADDARRAQMPMTEELADTSPIGLGFDLSSKDKVLRPLPKEEFDTSQGPLPALMVLNNEGVLSSWWIVYAESIRQGTTYPGLVVAGGPHQQQQQQQTERQASPFASANVQATPAFGQSTYGKPSTPAGNFGSTFGKPTGPAFGTGSNFGSTSTLGNAQTPFGAPTTSATTSQGGGSSFGQPSFGSSAPLGTVTGGPGGGAIPRSTAFGMAGGMVNRPSVWGTPASGTATASGSIFGQSGFSGKDTSPFAAGSAATPFGSNAAGNTAAPVSGGFASFAAKPSGFMTAPPSSAPSSGAENPFAKSTPGGSFGSGMDTDTSFGAIPNKDGEAPTSVFGGSGFILGSTFKGDGTAADDGPKPDVNAYNVLFGIDTVGEAQKDAATPQSNDADMDEEANTTPVESAQIAPIEKEKEKEKETTTPVAKPASPQFQFPSVPPSTGGLFGTQSQAKTTPAAVQGSQPAGFPVGKPTPITTPPKETPQGLDRLVRRSTETSPKVKNEPHSDDDGISPLNEGEAVIPEGYFTPTTPLVPKANTREPPLPPESTSKSSFAPGDSSNSSKSSIDEAGLPSDFLPSKSKLKEVEVVPEEHAALPEDDDVEEGGLDDEGSGVDVAQEISPSTDPASSPKITPGSSFGGPQDKSPVGGLFTTIQDGQKSRPLFGEVGKTSVPYLPPPSKVKESPRSPSPVRSAITRGLLRPENGRSISAPDPFKALTNRKNILSQSVVPAKPQASLEEIRRQEREILAAQKAKEAAEEEQDLSDREDERVREEMNTEVEGTKILDPFLAHQDYIGIVDKPGIPGQIEKVYRDINSMIDTLGLNARSLTAFVKGHSELHKAGGRSRNDLEDDDDWCLKEIEELGMIEKGLEDQLKDGRIQDVKGRLDECREFRKGISSLRSKGADIARAIDTRSDPQVMESTRSAPLPLDQATQQHEIRKQLMKFQKLMSDAEENITVLRAKLASCESSNVNGKALKKPTVEAVTKTIMKMTSLVEKKSGDVDVLENQMRHLRFSSVNSRSSREGSPFASLPSTSPRRKPAAQVTSSILRNGDPPALGRSPNGTGTARKGSQDLTEAEVQRYREKAQRRQQVNQTIKEAFSKTGPRIRDLE